MRVLNNSLSLCLLCRNYIPVNNFKKINTNQTSFQLRTFTKDVTSWNPFKKQNFGNYSIVKKPGNVTDKKIMPKNINLPPYALSSFPPPPPNNPEIKNTKQINGMRSSCHLARTIMDTVGTKLCPGITTDDIDNIVYNESILHNIYTSPLNYKGFPKSVCTSVNNIACHGIPDDRELVNGDIISVDITVYHNGFHGDCCESFLIGDVDVKGVHLVNATRTCRDKAIATCGPGIAFTTIGEMVEKVAEEESLYIIPVFIGHGIGSYFHGPPDIWHCYNNYPGVMKPGMTFTVEPILCQGTEQIIILEDGWTAATIDNSRAAQFEHTILITEHGCDILTDY